MPRKQIPSIDAARFASAAERLKGSDDFQMVFGKLFEAARSCLEAAQLDGSPEADKAALESLRKLQALSDFQRSLANAANRRHTED